MPHKADTTVICQCGAMVCKYYMPKHLRTAKHEIRMYLCLRTHAHAHARTLTHTNIQGGINH